MSRSAALTAIIDVLLHQRGERDPEIRRASLLTLNDSDLLSAAALLWTQIGWIWALTVSGWIWILVLSAFDAVLFATRWMIRRSLDPSGRFIGDTPEALFLSVNFGLMTLVAACVLVLTQTNSDRASVLAIILAVSFSGYAAALFTAFTVLASVHIGMLYGTLTFGLAMGPSDLTRPFAFLAPLAAIAFWILTQQTHATLLQAIRNQQHNRRLSLHDPLTKLPNRSYMHDALARLIASIGMDGGLRRVAILCLDLDGFKTINDRHGHAAGDWVLVRFAGILRECIGDGASACRIGGDEFVVLLPDADDAKAASVSAAIIRAVREPFDIGRTIPARIGVSIGATVVRSSSCAIDEVLERADAALYDAKRAGRGQLRISEEAA